MVGVALFWVGLACSTTTSQRCGGDAGACSSGDVCIMGGMCAQRCDVDGAASCPIGTTCQIKGGFCSGTACTAIAVMVCL